MILHQQKRSKLFGVLRPVNRYGYIYGDSKNDVERKIPITKWTKRQRQTDGETDRQIERETDRQTETERNRIYDDDDDNDDDDDDSDDGSDDDD